MAVFVTDGEQRATLAVVRALGREGIQATVGSQSRTSLAGSSRYCARSVAYPSPENEPEEFQAFLRREVQERQYKVLLPMTDVTLQLLSKARAALTPFVTLPIPEESSVRGVLDKAQILIKARELGIPCPRTFSVEGEESLEELSRRVLYPAVIKPRFSRYCRDGRWFSGGVEYARDAADLIAKYRAVDGQIPVPLIQEKVEGEGRGVFLLIWGGELKAAFCHRRLREKPPWGGVSVYSESVPLEQDLVQQSFSLLRASGWQGVAMVEYKRDERDGLCKLMEVNGRFWGSLQLAIDAGMNFPLMLYRLAAGDDVTPQFSYKVGVRSRWLLGDLDHLWIRLADSRSANGLSGRVPSRFRACMNFLKFYERGLHYEVQRIDDPRPAWFEFKSYLADGLGRVMGRGETTHAA